MESSPKNDHLVLLEFFVERVVYNDRVDGNLQGGKTVIEFQFLDNDPITIDATKANASLCGSPIINMGKSCLFSLTPPQAVEAANLFDLYVKVYQSRKCGLQQKVLVGIALIPLTNMFNEILKKSGDKETDSPPGGTKYIRHSVPLMDLEDNMVGHICASVRLSCYGKYIQTDFQMNMDHKSIDYKANEAQYRLNYRKKADACPEICGPTTNISCASPHTCGLSNPAIDPTPMPLPPPEVKLKQTKSKSTDGSKSSKKSKGGKAKAKGKPKGKGGKAAKAKVEKEPKVVTIPAPCPSKCYEKEKQAHISWNDCPITCLNAPSPDDGECPVCCPTNRDLQPQACPNICDKESKPLPSEPSKPPCCTFLKTLSGQPLVPTAICPKPECSLPPTKLPDGGKQKATAFTPGAKEKGPVPVVPQNQHAPSNCSPRPVTMMYASEANYSPNPPTDLYQMDMGLGGSLCCRVHEESPPAGPVPCPVNYMSPPTLDGKCPFSCVSGGNSTRNQLKSSSLQTNFGGGPPCQRPKQPQIVEMRPGLTEDTPFTLSVGNGAIDQNQLCVSPPTYIANDGTKYTELSDPKKQVFVMRIGKKYEGTMGGRNNIDLHLTTPPPPPPEPVVTCTYQQYNTADAAPGSKYFLTSGIVEKPSKTTKDKGVGKKGKKGKKGKGGQKKKK